MLAAWPCKLGDPVARKDDIVSDARTLHAIHDYNHRTRVVQGKANIRAVGRVSMCR